MKKAVEVCRREIESVRAGRASPALLEPIQVEAYGQKMKVQELATISTPDPRTLIIQPWDKGVLKHIEKAIQASDLGINPISQGDALRLNIPPLTQERREELVKLVHREAENGKVAVRNIRRDGKEALEKAKKEKQVTEDELHRLLDRLQKLTDRYTGEMDRVVEAKEREVLAF